MCYRANVPASGGNEVSADEKWAVKLYERAIDEGGHVFALNSAANVLKNREEE